MAGVFYDYGSSAGVVLMSRRTYERHWDDRAVSGLALEAAPGADLDAVSGSRCAPPPRAARRWSIRSNRGLREASLVIFDRTFAITGVLRMLTLAVAFIGVLSALIALQLERARELGVLRALGLTPRQVWGLVTAQTGLMGAIAGLLAVPVGLLLAFVLIFVVNRRSFGWTMPLELPPASSRRVWSWRCGRGSSPASTRRGAWRARRRRRRCVTSRAARRPRLVDRPRSRWRRPRVAARCGARRGRRVPQASLSVAEALGAGDLAATPAPRAPRPFAFRTTTAPTPGSGRSGGTTRGISRPPEAAISASSSHSSAPRCRRRGAGARASAWGASEVYLAHFAVTDTAGGRFQASSRAAARPSAWPGPAPRPFASGSRTGPPRARARTRSPCACAPRKAGLPSISS